MTATLTVRDETPAAGDSREWTLRVPSETLTIRDLIRERVYQEVQDRNLRPGPPGRSPDRPRDGEGSGPIDWKVPYGRAVEAFERGRVLILVDDRQAGSLDEEVSIRPGTTVTFLRLTLLAGG